MQSHLSQGNRATKGMGLKDTADNYWRLVCQLGCCRGFRDNSTLFNFSFCRRLARYDYVEVEDLTEKTVVGRWCGSQSVPAAHTSKGNQLRIHFVSDEYFPSEPGFCVRYSLLPLVRTSFTVASSLVHKNTQSFHVFFKDFVCLWPTPESTIKCQKINP